MEGLTIQKVADYLNPNVNNERLPIDNIGEFQEFVDRHLYSSNYCNEFGKTEYYWSQNNWYTVAQNILKEWKELTCTQSKL